MGKSLDLIISYPLRSKYQLWGERLSQTRPEKKTQSSLWQNWCFLFKTFITVLPWFSCLISATISVSYTDSYSSSQSINVEMTQNLVFGPLLLSIHIFSLHLIYSWTLKMTINIYLQLGLSPWTSDSYSHPPQFLHWSV